MGVLDHRDMELARQQHDGDHGKERLCQPRAPGEALAEQVRDFRRMPGLFEQRRGPAHHDKGNEQTGSDEGQELDHRFDRYRHHKAVLMLGRVDMAGAEQHGEGGHGGGDEEGDVFGDRQGCSAGS